MQCGGGCYPQGGSSLPAWLVPPRVSWEPLAEGLGLDSEGGLSQLRLAPTASACPGGGPQAPPWWNPRFATPFWEGSRESIWGCLVQLPHVAVSF